jgi:archaemetzincin
VIRRALRLVPLGPPFPPTELVDWLARELPRHLALAIRVLDQSSLPVAAPDAGAAADLVLDSLVDRFPPDGETAPDEWVLGLTAAPLHTRGRGTVFGEAALGGAWAIVTTAPITPDDPFLDRELLRERLLEEAIHELGHVAGLPHCDREGCIMTPARDVSEVDVRGDQFCRSCHTLLAALDPPLVDS